MIDKSNFDAQQYKADTAYECGRASVLSVIEDIKTEIKNLRGTFSNEYYLKIIDKHISGKEN